MVVYDAFMFFNEFELLSVRLAEHDPFVDWFILVQADRTHSGLKKDLLFSKSDPRFSKYAHKIIVVNVSLEANPKSAWDNESFQRQAVFTAAPFQSDDVVFLSDVDEMISRDHWPYLLKRMEKELVIGVWLQMFYYFVNLELKDHPWAMAKMIKAKVFLENLVSGNELRCAPAAVITPFPCGWHFSYLMSVEQIIEKIKAYGHQENNTQKFTNPEKIRRAIQSGEDIFDRGLKFQVIPFNQKWPKEMSSQGYWKSYILPSNVLHGWLNLCLRSVQMFLEPLKQGVRPLVKRFGLIDGKPDLYNAFGSDIFDELIAIRPKNYSQKEWRRLIEFCSFALPKLEGWLSARQCAELFIQIATRVRPNSKIVEVGSWKGRSSVFASRAASLSGSTLYCVDTWQGSFEESTAHPTVIEAKDRNVFLEFKRNIRLYGCDNVVVCRGDSVKTASSWSHGPIDFLFIDAGHDYESVLKDLKAWVPWVKPGGIVCGDDWHRDDCLELKGSVRKAFEDFFKSSLPNLGIVERFWAHQI
jgi:beta-1,4-mannosyl-glycoprotein beta-1,4-N-acetylglucosaminyltransferase